MRSSVQTFPISVQKDPKTHLRWESIVPPTQPGELGLLGVDRDRKKFRVRTGTGGRGGSTGLDLSRGCVACSSTWVPAGSPGPPLGGLLTNETVKA